MSRSITGAITAQYGHWKSLYSMIVTLASAAPLVQSASPTGGKMDCSVGPGVGWRDTTVQPELGSDTAPAVGTLRVAVATAGSVLAGLLVGACAAGACAVGACVAPPLQALTNMVSSSKGKISFRIFCSFEGYAGNFTS